MPVCSSEADQNSTPALAVMLHIVMICNRIAEYLLSDPSLLKK